MGASAGRVLLIPKGDWNAETTYTGLDWVRHNGAAWVCKNTCTNVEPTEENSDNWQIIARDGQSGSVINVDAAMSDTSENPVQNKVIKKYVDEHTPEISDMTGATATQNGAHGLVPAPQMGDEKKALLGDGTWGSVDAILTFKTKEEYDAAVANDEIPDGAKVIKEYDEGDSTVIIGVDTVMSDTSVNPVQNKVIKKYLDEKQINIDGVTLTLDEARNVIKLADTLKDKIGSALQPESIVNNQITTEEGFALDARQANPNLDGTLAKQISDLNGNLNLCVKIFRIPVNESIAIPCLNCIIFHNGNNGQTFSIVTTTGYYSDNVRSRISYINGNESNGLKLSYSKENSQDSMSGIFIIENTNTVNKADIAVIGIKNFSKM